MILTFAKADERVRMVTLEGSRTNINIPPDHFQDYDITFFVTDMQSFMADDEWLNVFGERLIMQKPEDMELFPAELWERLMATYRMDSYTQMWDSLEQCMALFRETSAEVARRLGCQYPPYDEKITEYVIRHKTVYGTDNEKPI